MFIGWDCETKAHTVHSKIIFSQFCCTMLVSHLLVLQFDSYHTEAVVDSVVVDVDAAEALLARFDWHPFFAGVIIDHHRGSGLTYTLFTMRKKQKH